MEHSSDFLGPPAGRFPVGTVRFPIDLRFANTQVALQTITPKRYLSASCRSEAGLLKSYDLLSEIGGIAYYAYYEKLYHFTIEKSTVLSRNTG